MMIFRSLIAGAVLMLPAAAAGQGVNGAVRYVVAADGNEARYRVREQLAGRDFPNDAVGATSRIEGAITLNGAGQPVAEDSRFVLDLASLESDEDRRDNYLRRRTLQTDSFPVAVLVPTAFRGLDASAIAAPATFQLVTEMTLHGVTSTVVWDVTAERDGDAIIGRATTRFPFATFGLEIPRLARLLSVDDDIRLEYDFRLVPQ